MKRGVVAGTIIYWIGGLYLAECSERETDRIDV